MKLLSRRRKLATALAIVALVVALPAAVHYPRQFDRISADNPVLNRPDYQAFYAAIYSNPGGGERIVSSEADDYVPFLAEFVRRFGLQGAHVLEVGAGAGTLQDVVADYTGLDISTESRRHFHKPFVEASATAIPFKTGEFDAVWTVNVLEHVPKPEQALSEMRRVLKNNGLLYLQAAWHVRTWAAQGYAVRPYGDLDLEGKMVKAAIPLRDSLAYRALYTLPIRAARLASRLWSNQPTTFRYTLLAPNYEKYWVPDSDAINSLDSYEAILWFTSRGDELVTYDGAIDPIFVRSGTLIVRVKKGS